MKLSPSRRVERITITTLLRNALAEALEKHLRELEKMPLSELLEARYKKFRNIAQYFETVGPPA